MTLGIKDMIARCIARMRLDECATCDQRDSCAIHRMGAFSPPPPPDANPFASLLGGIAKALVAAVERPSAFRREVESRIEALLETGEARVDRVAGDLGLSRQTLYRRLREEGVTFEELLDKLRHRLALRYLRDDRMSVKAASYRLGFSDPAAFSRAFKRWTGNSPRAAMA
jgi:AraC-like DNA-binding protein